MIRKTLSHGVLPLVVVGLLLVTAGPALAQHGGGHGGGGFHGGGSYHGGYGGYHGGYGGYNYGYHPYSGYNYGYSPYYRGYHVYPYSGGYYPYYGGGYYPYYGGGYYPYYGSGYFPYYYGSGFYTSDASGAANDPSTPPTQTPDADRLTKFSLTVPDDPAPGTGSNSARTTHITVRLPDHADLWFDTTQVTGTGPVREFNTPPLALGSRYTYDVRARWLDNGSVTDRKQTIAFAPGDKVEVSFPNPSGTGEKTNATVARDDRR
jgi:uncharacterized protein (TIGR03000 family)